MNENLSDFISQYNNSEDHNNFLFEYFTKKTDTVDYLQEHRNYIETNKLGFGERAFAYMWYLIINDIRTKGLNTNFLEIGVFKGQIVSLWSLIAARSNFDINVHGITPLSGNPFKDQSFLSKILLKISTKYKQNTISGNNYEDEDYLNIIKDLYTHFALDFHTIKLFKGYSTEPNIIERVSKQKFAIIYIDGDHTYDGVLHDIENYSGLVQKNGFLIMDDASCNIPGTKFWKGHQSVSDACKVIDQMPFKNVLNIGHNRIYQRL